MCMPPKEIIIRKLRQLLKEGKYESIFVASDNNHMIHELTNSLKKNKVIILEAIIFLKNFKFEL